MTNLQSYRISPLCRICVSVNRVSIGSDNGLSPIRRQAIIKTIAGLLSIGPLGTNFSESLIKIQNIWNIVCEMADILFRGEMS